MSSASMALWELKQSKTRYGFLLPMLYHRLEVAKGLCRSLKRLPGVLALER